MAARKPQKDKDPKEVRVERIRFWSATLVALIGVGGTIVSLARRGLRSAPSRHKPADLKMFDSNFIKAVLPHSDH